MRNKKCFSGVYYLNCLILFLVLVVASYSVIAAEKQVKEMKIAGLKTIFYPISDGDIVSVRLFILGGSAFQDKERAGIEKMTLGLLDKGSVVYGKDKTSEILTKTGGIITSKVDRDWSTISLKCIKRHLKTLLPLFLDLAVNPLFDEKAFKNEKIRQIQELKSLEDIPSTFLEYRLDRIFFHGHPYSSLNEGSVYTVGNLTVNDVRGFHKILLNKRRLMMVIVGNISENDFKPAIEASFGGLPSSHFPGLKKAPFKAFQMARFMIINKEIPTNYVRMRFLTPSPGDQDYPEMVVLNNILSDLLFRGVRTRAGLSYSIDAHSTRNFSSYGDIRFFSADPMGVFPLIFDEIKKLRNELLSKEEVGKYINVFLTGYYRNRETVDSLSMLLGGYEILTGAWRDGFHFDEKIMSITAERIRAAAQRYLQSFVFAYLGNRKMIDQQKIIEQEAIGMKKEAGEKNSSG